MSGLLFAFKKNFRRGKLSSLLKQYFAPATTASTKSFTDKFAHIIERINDRKKSNINQTERLVPYKPRYTYEGQGKKHHWISVSQVDHELFKSRPKSSLGYVKKYCLLLGYAGANYLGIQRQRDQNPNTIEEQLLKVLLKHQWITSLEHSFTKNLDFARASRTDKGVSAVKQCISLLLLRDFQHDIAALNADLPADIRIFAMERVTKQFNARTTADKRTYSYTLPTVAFAHHADCTPMKDFRVSAEKLKQVYDILQIYKGVKNYHNFTINRDFFEKNCYRYMQQLDIGEPFMRNDIELLTIRIKGASFMMHQIRKMIGLLLAVIREVVEPSVFHRVFTSHTVDVPRAPGLGLVLEQVHYEKYNRIFGEKGFHNDLTWTEFDGVVNDFREKCIFPTIIRGELEDESMSFWLPTLFWHSYSVVSQDKIHCVRKGRRPRTTFYIAPEGDIDLKQKNAIEK